MLHSLQSERDFLIQRSNYRMKMCFSWKKSDLQSLHYDNWVVVQPLFVSCSYKGCNNNTVDIWNDFITTQPFESKLSVLTRRSNYFALLYCIETSRRPYVAIRFSLVHTTHMICVKYLKWLKCQRLQWHPCVWVEQRFNLHMCWYLCGWHSYVDHFNRF